MGLIIYKELERGISGRRGQSACILSVGEPGGSWRARVYGPLCKFICKLLPWLPVRSPAGILETAIPS